MTKPSPGEQYGARSSGIRQDQRAGADCQKHEPRMNHEFGPRQTGQHAGAGDAAHRDADHQRRDENPDFARGQTESALQQQR
jgi:hypothetical protein